MAKMKRGVLIDVAKMDVREVEFDGLDTMYKLIDCDMVECVSISRNEDLWLDEEGLMKNDGKGHFYYKGHLSQAFKGNGLVTGGVDANGNTKACKLSVEEIRNKVIFAL